MRLVVQIVWVQEMAEGWSVVICPQKEHLVRGDLSVDDLEWKIFPPIQYLGCIIFMKSSIALSPAETLSASHDHLPMPAKISSGGLSVFYTPVISVSSQRSLDQLLNSKIGSQWCAMFSRHTAPYVHLLSWFNVVFPGIASVLHRCHFRFPPFSLKRKRFAQVPRKINRWLSKKENLKSDNLCGNSPLSDSLLYRPEVWSYEIFKSVAIMSFSVKVWHDSL